MPAPRSSAPEGFDRPGRRAFGTLWITSGFAGGQPRDWLRDLGTDFVCPQPMLADDHTETGEGEPSPCLLPSVFLAAPLNPRASNRCRGACPRAISTPKPPCSAPRCSTAT